MVRFFAAALLAAGVGLVVQSLWIPAKAQLAQVLLQRAWHRTVGGTVGDVGAATASPPVYRPWSWADTFPVARLQLPTSNETEPPLIVLSGDSGQAMAFAPGLRGGRGALRTSRNLVIGGHRDTHFAALEHVAIGDEIALETPQGEQRRYRVQHLDIVDHRDTRLLEPLDGVELLTLVTCWPFDAVVPGGPLRYVVQAERI